MKPSLKIICLSIFIICNTHTTASLADTNPKLAYQRIINSIKHLQQKIFSDKHQLQALEDKVKKSDLAIQQLSKKLEKTQAALRLKKTSLAQLHTSIKTQQAAIAQQQNKLGQQLKLSYMLGQSDHIKLLLSQRSPHTIDRMLHYTYYLHMDHVQHIVQSKQRIVQLNDMKQQANSTQKELLDLLKKQKAQKKQLETTQASRSQLISKTTHQLDAHHHELKQLIANKKNLEQIITDLQQKMTQQQYGFGTERGKLPWPLTGKVTNHFNDPIQGTLKHTGMIIAAPTGTPVRAIAAGQVVFARWLKGFGLLVIINHGNGYMSLYGRNNSLYQKEGDQVKQGTLIATVGQSGGFRAPALYFSIRHNKELLDPARWCQGTNITHH